MAKILKTNILPYLKSKTYLKGKIDELLLGKSPNKHAVNNDTYGLGTTGVYGHVKTVNGLTQASHQDGLALAAYQGKVLKDLVDGKASTKHTHTKSEITDFPNTMTPSSHAHGALANGGTLNSDITSVNKIAVTDSSNNLKTISKLPLDKVTHQDITGKVDKISGKSLSANDFTDELKSKLDSIYSGARAKKRILGYLITSDIDTTNQPLIRIQKDTRLKVRLYDSENGNIVEGTEGISFPSQLQVNYCINNVNRSLTTTGGGSTFNVGLPAGEYPVHFAFPGSGNYYPVYRSIILQVV